MALQRSKLKLFDDDGVNSFKLEANATDTTVDSTVPLEMLTKLGVSGVTAGSAAETDVAAKFDEIDAQFAADAATAAADLQGVVDNIELEMGLRESEHTAVHVAVEAEKSARLGAQAYDAAQRAALQATIEGATLDERDRALAAEGANAAAIAAFEERLYGPPTQLSAYKSFAAGWDQAGWTVTGTQTQDGDGLRVHAPAYATGFVDHTIDLSAYGVAEGEIRVVLESVHTGFNGTTTGFVRLNDSALDPDTTPGDPDIAGFNARTYDAATRTGQVYATASQVVETTPWIAVQDGDVLRIGEYAGIIKIHRVDVRFATTAATSAGELDEKDALIDQTMAQLVGSSTTPGTLDYVQSNVDATTVDSISELLTVIGETASGSADDPSSTIVSLLLSMQTSLAKLNLVVNTLTSDTLVHYLTVNIAVPSNSDWSYDLANLLTNRDEDPSHITWEIVSDPSGEVRLEGGTRFRVTDGGVNTPAYDANNLTQWTGKLRVTHSQTNEVATVNFIAEVVQNTSPIFTNPPDVLVVTPGTSQAGVTTFVATDSQLGLLTYSIANAPPGFSIGASSGVLSYDGTAWPAGEVIYESPMPTVSVQDSGGEQGSHTVRIRRVHVLALTRDSSVTYSRQGDHYTDMGAESNYDAAGEAGYGVAASQVVTDASTPGEYAITYTTGGAYPATPIVKTVRVLPRVEEAHPLLVPAPTPDAGVEVRFVDTGNYPGGGSELLVGHRDDRFTYATEAEVQAAILDDDLAIGYYNGVGDGSGPNFEKLYPIGAHGVGSIVLHSTTAVQWGTDGSGNQQPNNAVLRVVARKKVIRATSAGDPIRFVDAVVEGAAILAGTTALLTEAAVATSLRDDPHALGYYRNADGWYGLYSQEKVGVDTNFATYGLVNGVLEPTASNVTLVRKLERVQPKALLGAVSDVFAAGVVDANVAAAGVVGDDGAGVDWLRHADHATEAAAEAAARADATAVGLVRNRFADARIAAAEAAPTIQDRVADPPASQRAGSTASRGGFAALADSALSSDTCWASATSAADDSEYVEIDLGRAMEVRGLRTKGCGSGVHLDAQALKPLPAKRWWRVLVRGDTSNPYGIRIYWNLGASNSTVAGLHADSPHHPGTHRTTGSSGSVDDFLPSVVVGGQTFDRHSVFLFEEARIPDVLVVGNRGGNDVPSHYAVQYADGDETAVGAAAGTGETLRYNRTLIARDLAWKTAFVVPVTYVGTTSNVVDETHPVTATYNGSLSSKTWWRILLSDTRNTSLSDTTYPPMTYRYYLEFDDGTLSTDDGGSAVLRNAGLPTSNDAQNPSPAHMTTGHTNGASAVSNGVTFDGNHYNFASTVQLTVARTVVKVHFDKSGPNLGGIIVQFSNSTLVDVNSPAVSNGNALTWVTVGEFPNTYDAGSNTNSVNGSHAVPVQPSIAVDGTHGFGNGNGLTVKLSDGSTDVSAMNWWRPGYTFTVPVTISLSKTWWRILLSDARNTSLSDTSSAPGQYRYYLEFDDGTLSTDDGASAVLKFAGLPTSANAVHPGGTHMATGHTNGATAVSNGVTFDGNHYNYANTVQLAVARTVVKVHFDKSGPNLGGIIVQYSDSTEVDATDPAVSDGNALTWVTVGEFPNTHDAGSNTNSVNGSHAVPDPQPTLALTVTGVDAGDDMFLHVEPAIPAGTTIADGAAVTQTGVFADLQDAWVTSFVARKKNEARHFRVSFTSGFGVPDMAFSRGVALVFTDGTNSTDAAYAATMGNGGAGAAPPGASHSMASTGPGSEAQVGGAPHYAGDTQYSRYFTFVVPTAKTVDRVVYNGWDNAYNTVALALSAWDGPTDAAHASKQWELVAAFSTATSADWLDDVQLSAPAFGDLDGGAVFAANADADTTVTNLLAAPTTASVLRLYPRAYEGWAALRADVVVGTDKVSAHGPVRYVRLEASRETLRAQQLQVLDAAGTNLAYQKPVITNALGDGSLSASNPMWAVADGSDATHGEGGLDVETLRTFTYNNYTTDIHGTATHMAGYSNVIDPVEDFVQTQAFDPAVVATWKSSITFDPDGPLGIRLGWSHISDEGQIDYTVDLSAFDVNELLVRVVLEDRWASNNPSHTHDPTIGCYCRLNDNTVFTHSNASGFRARSYDPVARSGQFYVTTGLNTVEFTQWIAVRDGDVISVGEHRGHCFLHRIEYQPSSAGGKYLEVDLGQEHEANGLRVVLHNDDNPRLVGSVVRLLSAWPNDVDGQRNALFKNTTAGDPATLAGTDKDHAWGDVAYATTTGTADPLPAAGYHRERTEVFADLAPATDAATQSFPPGLQTPPAGHTQTHATEELAAAAALGLEADHAAGYYQHSDGTWRLLFGEASPYVLRAAPYGLDGADQMAPASSAKQVKELRAPQDAVWQVLHSAAHAGVSATQTFGVEDGVPQPHAGVLQTKVRKPVREKAAATHQLVAGGVYSPARLASVHAAAPEWTSADLAAAFGANDDAGTSNTTTTPLNGADPAAVTAAGSNAGGDVTMDFFVAKHAAAGWQNKVDFTDEIHNYGQANGTQFQIVDRGLKTNMGGTTAPFVGRYVNPNDAADVGVTLHPPPHTQDTHDRTVLEFTVPTAGFYYLNDLQGKVASFRQTGSNASIPLHFYGPDLAEVATRTISLTAAEVSAGLGGTGVPSTHTVAGALAATQTVAGSTFTSIVDVAPVGGTFTSSEDAETTLLLADDAAGASQSGYVRGATVSSPYVASNQLLVWALRSPGAATRIEFVRLTVDGDGGAVRVAHGGYGHVDISAPYAAAGSSMTDAALVDTFLVPMLEGTYPSTPFSSSTSTFDGVATTTVTRGDVTLVSVVGAAVFNVEGLKIRTAGTASFGSVPAYQAFESVALGEVAAGAKFYVAAGHGGDWAYDQAVLKFTVAKARFPHANEYRADAADAAPLVRLSQNVLAVAAQYDRPADWLRPILPPAEYSYHWISPTMYDGAGAATATTAVGGQTVSGAAFLHEVSVPIAAIRTHYHSDVDPATGLPRASLLPYRPKSAVLYGSTDGGATFDLLDTFTGLFADTAALGAATAYQVYEEFAVPDPSAAYTHYIVSFPTTYGAAAGQTIFGHFEYVAAEAQGAVVHAMNDLLAVAGTDAAWELQEQDVTPRAAGGVWTFGPAEDTHPPLHREFGAKLFAHSIPWAGGHFPNQSANAVPTAFTDTVWHQKWLCFRIDGERTRFEDGTLVLTAQSPEVTDAEATGGSILLTLTAEASHSDDSWNATMGAGHMRAHFEGSLDWTTVPTKFGGAFTTGDWTQQPDFHLKFRFPDGSLYRITFTPSAEAGLAGFPDTPLYSMSDNGAGAAGTLSAGLRRYAPWNLATLEALPSKFGPDAVRGLVVHGTAKTLHYAAVGDAVSTRSVAETVGLTARGAVNGQSTGELALSFERGYHTYAHTQTVSGAVRGVVLADFPALTVNGASAFSLEVKLDLRGAADHPVVLGLGGGPRFFLGTDGAATRKARVGVPGGANLDSDLDIGTGVQLLRFVQYGDGTFQWFFNGVADARKGHDWYGDVALGPALKYREAHTAVAAANNDVGTLYHFKFFNEAVPLGLHNDAADFPTFQFHDDPAARTILADGSHDAYYVSPPIDMRDDFTVRLEHATATSNSNCMVFLTTHATPTGAGSDPMDSGYTGPATSHLLRTFYYGSGTASDIDLFQAASTDRAATNGTRIQTGAGVSADNREHGQGTADKAAHFLDIRVSGLRYDATTGTLRFGYALSGESAPGVAAEFPTGFRRELAFPVEAPPGDHKVYVHFNANPMYMNGLDLTIRDFSRPGVARNAAADFPAFEFSDATASVGGDAATHFRPVYVSPAITLGDDFDVRVRQLEDSDNASYVVRVTQDPTPVGWDLTNQQYPGDLFSNLSQFYIMFKDGAVAKSVFYEDYVGPKSLALGAVPDGHLDLRVRNLRYDPAISRLALDVSLDGETGTGTAVSSGTESTTAFFYPTLPAPTNNKVYVHVYLAPFSGTSSGALVDARTNGKMSVQVRNFTEPLAAGQ